MRLGRVIEEPRYNSKVRNYGLGRKHQKGGLFSLRGPVQGSGEMPMDYSPRHPTEAANQKKFQNFRIGLPVAAWPVGVEKNNPPRSHTDQISPQNCVPEIIAFKEFHVSY